jgi:hypothetical protein
MRRPARCGRGSRTQCWHRLAGPLDPVPNRRLADPCDTRRPADLERPTQGFLISSSDVTMVCLTTLALSCKAASST